MVLYHIVYIIVPASSGSFSCPFVVLYFIFHDRSLFTYNLYAVWM